MHGRQDRHRLAREIDAGEYARGFGNTRQALGQDFRIEMVEVEEDVILLRPDAAAFADFDGHRAGNHVARGEILGRRRVTLHEALAFRIDEVGAFAARAFGDEHAGAVDAGGVELDEFHVLERQAGPQHHGIAIAGLGVRAGARGIGAAIAAGRQDRHLRGEAVDRAVVEIDGNNAAAVAVVVHDQIDGEIFNEELGRMP